MREYGLVAGLLFLMGWAGFGLWASLLAGVTIRDVESRGYSVTAGALMLLVLSWLPGFSAVLEKSALGDGVRGMLWALMGLGLVHAVGAFPLLRSDRILGALVIGAFGWTLIVGLKTPLAAAMAVATWGGATWRFVRGQSRQAVETPERMAGVGAFLIYLLAMGLTGIRAVGTNGLPPRISLVLVAAIPPLLNLVILGEEQRRHRESLAWQRRLAIVLKAFREGVFLTDTTGKIMTPLTPDGPGRSHTVEELFPGSVADTIRETILKTVLSGEEQTILFSKESAGEIRWYEGRAAKLFPRLREKGVLFVFRDRTETIRLEQEGRNTLEKYERLFHDSPDALFVLDDEGTILDANEQAEILFEIDRATLCQRRIVTLMEGLSSEAVEDEEYQLRRRTQYTARRRFRRASGSVFPAEWQVTRFRLGDRVLRLASVRDLTGRQRDEERLEQAERLEAVGRFAGILAHDFNNVLAGIGGCVELLAQRCPPDSEIAFCLDVMKQAVKRGTSLTQQLLNFARQRLGPAVPIEAGGVLRELTDLITPSLPSSILLRCYRPVEPLWFLAEPTEIRQALLNLVVNATDAMPHGGTLKLEAESVRIGSEQPWRGQAFPLAGEYVVFRVSDTGVGMSESVRAHLFEPFFTTKEGGKGTGMGLAMVHGVVRGRGGFVEVESEPGKGTVVTLGFLRIAPEDVVVREGKKQKGSVTDRTDISELDVPRREET